MAKYENMHFVFEFGVSILEIIIAALPSCAIFDTIFSVPNTV